MCESNRDAQKSALGWTMTQLKTWNGMRGGIRIDSVWWVSSTDCVLNEVSPDK